MGVRMHPSVRADAPCFTPGNLKKDGTVRPSHGRPRGHRLIVRPSVGRRPCDNPALSQRTGWFHMKSRSCLWGSGWFWGVFLIRTYICSVR
jgi:hypothetical protein